jgi:DNA-binding transcriptional regulator LsrR (DeoR family)
MSSLDLDAYGTIRLISKVLNLYYVEERTQADIAKRLHLSTSKVNRLLKQARQRGFVKVSLQTPFQSLFEIEVRLQEAFNLNEAVVIPRFVEDSDAVLETIGRAAGEYLLQKLQDGDTICISGGKSVRALVQTIEPSRAYDVRVVPATGARQGITYTDVNYLAAQLAEELGGQAYKLHAPVFVDTPEERQAVVSLRQVAEVLDIARHARIALVGVGSVIPEYSSYFDLMSSMPISKEKWHNILTGDGYGEIFAHVYDAEGRPCLPQFNDRVIGLTLNDLRNIPLSIGIAATQHKVRPIQGALRGGYLKALITEEMTARGVLEESIDG